VASRLWGRGCLWDVPTFQKEVPMPDKTSDTIIAAATEQLVAEGPRTMAQVITVTRPWHALPE
jgi:hypothetical protein